MDAVKNILPNDVLLKTVHYTIPSISPIELDGETLDVQYFLTKHFDDIGEASLELPAIIEWISSKLQGIVESKLCKENELERVEAEVWFYLQNGGFEDRNYTGKKTQYSLSMALRLDDKVKAIKDEIATLTGWQQRLENLVYSLRSKLEIVRSVETTRRSQLSSPSHEDEEN
jgi:hypothetical protein